MSKISTKEKEFHNFLESGFLRIHTPWPFSIWRQNFMYIDVVPYEGDALFKKEKIRVYFKRTQYEKWIDLDGDIFTLVAVFCSVSKKDENKFIACLHSLHNILEKESLVYQHYKEIIPEKDLKHTGDTIKGDVE